MAGDEVDAALIFSIAFASASAILQVILQATVGGLLAWMGVIDKEGNRTISKMLFLVLLPCLIFKASMGAVKIITQIPGWWLLPFFSFMHAVLGLGVGYGLLYGARVKCQNPRAIVLTQVLGNSGGVPLVIVAAVAQSSLFKDDPNAMHDGMSYVVLYLAATSITMWVFGYNYLIHGEEEDLEEGTSVAELVTPRAQQMEGVALFDDANGDGDEGGDNEGVDKAGEDPEMAREDEGQAMVIRTPRQRTLDKVMTTVKNILSPPLLATLFGLLLGLTPVERLLFDPTAPLFPIGNVIGRFGGSAIPLTLMVLGANVFHGHGSASTMSKKDLNIVAGARLCVMPMLGVMVYAVAYGSGFVPSDNRMFKFVLLLESAVPTANNLVLMTQLSGIGVEEIAQVIFTQYTAAAFTLTFCVTMFLLVVVAV